MVSSTVECIIFKTIPEEPRNQRLKRRLASVRVLLIQIS